MKNQQLLAFIIIISYFLFLGFSTDIDIDLLRKREDRKIAIRHNGIGVTVVVTYKQNPNSIKKLLSRLEPKQFFTEVIIWNNYPDSINANDFPSSIEVRVVNSPSDNKDMGKFVACHLAVNPFCYYQEPDWDNTYITSMWSNVRLQPKKIHSVVPPNLFWELRKLTFFRREAKQVQIHTGFTWLQFGSFFSKERASIFLFQLGSSGLLSYSELSRCDPLLSLFVNDMPVVYENPLEELPAIPADEQLKTTKLPHSSSSSSNTAEPYDLLEIIKKGMLQMYSYMKENFVNIFPITSGLIPAFEDRDVRAVCYNDQCLFLTNLDSFPSPKAVLYDPDDFSLERFNPEVYPSKYFWLEHAYHMAVDNDPNTCWTSLKKPVNESYFGLDLLTVSSQYEEFLLVIQYIDDKVMKELFFVTVSIDGNKWENLAMSWTITAKTTFKIKLEKTERGFRYIRFMTKIDNFKFPFSVCQFSLLSSKKGSS